MTSPSEAYARFRSSQQHPVTAEFADSFPFGLDDFQIRGCREIEDGRGVLVAAPTGAGKTVVGEFAVHLALREGRKAFYTTPIKALSNQKFSDLVEKHGAANVGLLTGDTSINGEAPVVVMTTEVLRNMLYANSRTLEGLGYVVMDEVHYLADRNRGAVWEEVIIHLPESVQVVSLSATVSNAEEFGEWLGTVRGDTTTVLEEKRPVPLFQHVMVGRKIYDLFDSNDVDASAGFVKEGAPVNAELMRVARDDFASQRLMRDRRNPKGQRGATKGQRNVGNGRRVWVPSRVDVVRRLEEQGLLPAINFIFSRNACDAAVSQLLAADVRLTTREEGDEIRAQVESAAKALPPEDLQALGYHEFLEGLVRGVAAHHAGLLPAFKTVVEDLFAAGLVKIVFATETLALGINMPARTVVIEKLSKWNGETHADLTPGEYTQLTGRAGRRGLDVEGHAVVLWQPGIDPRQVAGLASTRTYPLRSSFRPSYNMAVNMVHQFGYARSRELLEQSFAQFQADRSVVGLARQLHKADEALEGYLEAATCHLGDFMDYAALRRSISEVEKDAARARRNDRRAEAMASLRQLTTGDVIEIPAGKFAGWAVVVDPGLANPDEPRPYVLTLGREARRLVPLDFPVPVEARTRIKVPKNFNGRVPQSRKDLAMALGARVRGLPRGAEAPRKGARNDAVEQQLTRLRQQLKAHPCHGCEEREDHARWAERWFKLKRDGDVLRRRVETRTNTVARTFDRVCSVLTALQYLDGDTVTDRGRHLMRIHTEMDLVAAEALREGIWNDLDPSELAGALSVLVYEARGPGDQSPRPASKRIQKVVTETQRLWRQLDLLERDHKLDFLRPPDAGFAWAAWRWAEGDDLDDVLTETGLSAGDFVRVMKQLLDLTGQVAHAAAGTPIQKTAREAADRLRRGVIALSTAGE
ncbi:DEAD/DEAH box helicase [Nocardioides yefusunii]|uniref:DEAD/DEAH box helicase n=1 Tax=Nocardioides yefusunii TaxID=2500546 RepID=A0ABW1QSL5_9ACTN|nr:DEAD/DEAH box helicase [Nocardioides yefusunii]